ncbi:tRNA(adenine(34)) deaminase, chloroplastic-like isoform X2 [Diospyros lotus]|uniref:tRNA(adenine(34)) deaminase, chloroplastic-like isoform X2 n=1 Tax=Diospyros lotus TaxID=55363 RepID=UPI0022540081|nr:tRNA(adenine(34)) deaminase, chloroplastic-like isoform X2 [Diospyros lotus]
MYNSSYFTSVLSLRCKASLLCPSNDYSFLNERIERNSFGDYCYFLNEKVDSNLVPLSSPSSICVCCGHPLYRVLISPGFFYGLRQSALLQRSASRRLSFGCRERRESCCGHGRRGRWKERRFSRMVLEESSKRDRSRDFDDAEVMLSLLTEEVGEECFGAKGRNFSSSRRVKVENRVGGAGGTCRKKTGNVDSGLLESKSKRGFESVRIESGGKEYRRKEENGRREYAGNFLQDEKSRERKGGSTCSSYYTCSSVDEFESDTEVHVTKEGSGKESGSELKWDLEKNGEVKYDREILEEGKKGRDIAGGNGVVMQPGKTAAGSYAAPRGFESDWRKKSEKKLTEVSIEQIKTRDSSSQKQSSLLEVQETGYSQASSSHKQFDEIEKKSTFSLIMDDGIRQQYSQKGDQSSEKSESRMKYFSQAQEIHGSDVEVISSSEKYSGGSEENLSAEGSSIQETRHVHSKIAGRTAHKDDDRRNSQQYHEVSEIEEINSGETSTSRRQSEARMKKQEDISTVILSSVRDTEERHDVAGQWDSRKMDSQIKFQQLTELSDAHGTAASLRHSDTEMKNEESNLNFILCSSEQEAEEQLQMGQRAISRRESRKTYPGMNNKSSVHSSDAQIINIQGTSEERISSQETYVASVVKKSTAESKEEHILTEEGVFGIGSTKETQRPGTEVTSIRASSPQESSMLKTQPIMQPSGVHMGNKSSSQVIVMPPPSQVVAKGPSQAGQSSNFAIQEISGANLESDFDALPSHAELDAPDSQHETYIEPRRDEICEEPLDVIFLEDALGSADQFHKSSTLFVGDFIEKVKNEVSTSEVENVNGNSEKELVNEVHEHQLKSSTWYDSGEFQSKEHGLRHLSWSSGVKGSSDEIRDLIDPPSQQHAESEGPDDSTQTANVVARRTGRSLWNIISDIVLLRWVSRSKSHNLTLKSGGKSASNQSAGSETWFSGHELDENSDENVKREKKSISQESTSVDQQHLGTIPTGSPRKGSSSAGSEDNKYHMRVDALSSSSPSRSVSASEGNLSVSTEKKFGRSVTAMPESSVSKSSLHVRSPNVDEISEGHKTDVSASGSSVLKQQLVGTGLGDASGTEGKVGELKQTKLQRTHQVPKDRFDEWEEAYKLENEQQKIDEMFMREALLEAKKAADMWEVPVGAVLVQNGKIIARGCNLVEELRDSTAHAEMICIREASNLLHSWRLAAVS